MTLPFKIISFITEHQVIRKILEHLDLWEQKASRDPPNRETSSENNDLIYSPYEIQQSWNSETIISQGGPFDDDWSGYEESCIMANLC
jgi:hypothetical protein